MNTIEAIIDFEDGNLDTRGTVELFAELIKTGLAWTLQGHYGRTANWMIKNELVKHDGTINEDTFKALENEDANV